MVMRVLGKAIEPQILDRPAPTMPEDVKRYAAVVESHAVLLHIGQHGQLLLIPCVGRGRRFVVEDTDLDTKSDGARADVFRALRDDGDTHTFDSSRRLGVWLVAAAQTR